MALSKTQSRRLGAILSVMFKENAPNEAVTEVIADGYVVKDGDNLVLTEKGNDERNRLSTLAGLNIKYATERQSKVIKPDAQLRSVPNIEYKKQT